MPRDSDLLRPTPTDPTGSDLLRPASIRFGRVTPVMPRKLSGPYNLGRGYDIGTANIHVAPVTWGFAPVA
jgi:hypothetical protein